MVMFFPSKWEGPGSVSRIDIQKVEQGGVYLEPQVRDTKTGRSVGVLLANERPSFLSNDILRLILSFHTYANKCVFS